MHPRRLEKNANITLKSALRPRAVCTCYRSRSRPMASKERGFTNSFHLKKEGAASNSSARRGENPVLGLEKLNSPQA